MGLGTQDFEPFLETDGEDALADLAALLRQRVRRANDRWKRRWALWTALSSVSGICVMLIGVVFADEWGLTETSRSSIRDGQMWPRLMMVDQWVLLLSYAVVVFCLVKYYYYVLLEKRSEWARSGAKGGVKMWRTSLPYALLAEVLYHTVQPWPFLEPRTYVYKLLQLSMMFRIYTIIRALYNYSETTSNQYGLTYADGRKRRKVRWTTTLKVQFYQHTVAYLVGITVALVLVGGLSSVIAEHEKQPLHFSSILDGLWYSWVTFTTVGYGDRFPQTHVGRLVGSMIAALGLLVVALAGGVLTNKLALNADQRMITSHLRQRVLRSELRTSAALIIQLSWKLLRISRGNCTSDTSKGGLDLGLLQMDLPPLPGANKPEDIHFRRYKIIKKAAHARRELEEAVNQQYDTDRKVEELINLNLEQAQQIEVLTAQIAALANAIQGLSKQRGVVTKSGAEIFAAAVANVQIGHTPSVRASLPMQSPSPTAIPPPQSAWPQAPAPPGQVPHPDDIPTFLPSIRQGRAPRHSIVNVSLSAMNGSRTLPYAPPPGI